jgi:hypothetical protein
MWPLLDIFYGKIKHGGLLGGFWPFAGARLAHRRVIGYRPPP